MVIIEELKYFFRHKFPSIIKGKLKGNSVYAYWGKYPNFGDQLTPLILEYYGFTPIYSSYKPRLPFAKKAELISVGTILNNTPIEYDGVILGSGIHNDARRLPNAKVIGVRGRLTQKSLGLEYKNIVLGDPGLLVSRILPIGYEKRWELGIVPHFADKGDRVISQWQNKFENKVRVIDVQRKPEVVINEIASCKNIISSSLHGLVTADSYGIPNEMFAIRRNMPSIHDFKYRDYYSALGISLSVLEADGNETLEYIISRVTCKKELVDPIKEKLHQAFLSLRHHLNRK
jgi:pyruvyltransferase